MEKQIIVCINKYSPCVFIAGLCIGVYLFKRSVSNKLIARRLNSIDETLYNLREDFKTLKEEIN